MVLVDTNVVSYRYNRRPEFNQFISELEGKIPAISFVTYAEAMEGSYEARWPEKRTAQYDAYLRANYMLLPIDRELAIRFARMVSECRSSGISLSGDNDLWIAATALRYDIPLLTNDQPFRRIPGLTVLPRRDTSEQPKTG